MFGKKKASKDTTGAQQLANGANVDCPEGDGGYLATHQRSGMTYCSKGDRHDWDSKEDTVNRERLWGWR